MTDNNTKEEKKEYMKYLEKAKKAKKPTIEQLLAKAPAARLRARKKPRKARPKQEFKSKIKLAKRAPKKENIVMQIGDKISSYSHRISEANMVLLVLLAFVILLTGLFLIKPVIIGYLVAEESNQYLQEVDFKVQKSKGYQWDIPEHHLLFTLDSLKLSGSAAGNGEFAAYLEDENGERFLILNRGSLETGGSEIITGSILEENTTEEPVILEFSNACIETCSLLGLNQTSYVFVFELEQGVELQIDSIEYGLQPVEDNISHIEVEKEPVAAKGLLKIRGEQKQNLSARVKLKKDGNVIDEFDIYEMPEIEGDNYELDVEIDNHPIKRIIMKEVSIKPNATDIIKIDDVEETGNNSGWAEVYAIDPTAANFTEADVTAVAKGSSLYKCKDWNFEEQICYGEWVFLQAITPGEEYTFILTPEDPGFAEVVSSCSAEDNAAKGSFAGACDDPTGASLEKNDGTTETHTYPKTLYAGVRIQSVNTSVTDCVSIIDVFICYEWWRTNTADPLDCDISVDADAGASYTAVTTACPDITADPGINCTNISSAEIWNCSNFFGAAGTRAYAKSEISRVGSGGPTTETATWDVFYFNVTYQTVSACVDNDGDSYNGSGTGCGPVDCNDTNSSIYPGAAELCNEVDDDCDALVDEDYTLKGTGCSAGIGACQASGVYVCAANQTGVICNAAPGTPTNETCNNIDDDCDTFIDEDLVQSCGVGACAGTQTCAAGAWGTCSSDGNDCGTCAVCNSTGICNYDDTQDIDCSPTICPADGCGAGGCTANIYGDYPVNAANECSAIYTCTANSCTVTCEADNDGDTYSISCGDCNDTNSSINPGAAEVCNGVDDNCDGNTDEGSVINCSSNSECGTDGCISGTYYSFTCNNAGTCLSYCSNVTSITDADGDMYDTECDNDCDDTNSSIYPGAVEVCNGVDDNCDTLIDEGFAIACNNNADCGTDRCIIGTYYIFSCNNAGTCLSYCSNTTSITDSDLDGYDTECDSDCDDTNASINPGIAEVCNGLDENCNAFIDEGFTDENCQYVCQNNGYTWLGTFCCGNDANEASPYEVNEASCADGNDNDCDGLIDSDDADCDDVAPTITSSSVSPYDPVVGDNVNLDASASDNFGVDSLYANITLPDGSRVKVALPGSYTLVLTGRHNITFIANDTNGNIAAEEDYLIAGSTAVNVQFNVVDSGLSGVQTNLIIYFRGTDDPVNNYTFNGTDTVSHTDVLYDLLYDGLSGFITVRLNCVNLSVDNNKTLGLDKNKSITGYLAVYGVNNTYSICDAVVRIYYNDLSFSSESNLKLYKCDGWDFTGKNCIAGWTDITSQAVQNTAEDYFEVTVSSFSGFGLSGGAAEAVTAEVIVERAGRGGGYYCGDDVCTIASLVGENCRNCPEDCGECLIEEVIGEEEVAEEEAGVSPEIEKPMFICTIPASLMILMAVFTAILSAVSIRELFKKPTTYYRRRRYVVFLSVILMIFLLFLTRCRLSGYLFMLQMIFVMLLILSKIKLKGEISENKA